MTNVISHAVGLLLSIVGLLLMLLRAGDSGDVLRIVSAAIFGAGLIALYLASTLYHSARDPKVRSRLRVNDHATIYVLIAGTYTPFMLISLRSSSGMMILGLVWALAMVGILSELLLSGKAVKISQIVIYLGMGWSCSLDFASLKAALPTAGFWWLLAGGLAYTGGVFFYLLDKANWLDHAHGIWHFFVLLGSACHFIAVAGYVR